MNEKIDVLGVMDDQISVIHAVRSPEELAWHHRVVLAREAIAELISAADDLTDSCGPECHGWGRLVNVLERIKGEPE